MYITIFASTVQCVTMKSVLVLLLRNFVHKLTSSAKAAGLKMAPDPCAVHVFDHQGREKLEDIFKRMCRDEPQLKLIVTILDKRGDVGPGYSEWLCIGLLTILACARFKCSFSGGIVICTDVTSTVCRVNFVVQKYFRCRGRLQNFDNTNISLNCFFFAYINSNEQLQYSPMCHTSKW